MRVALGIEYDGSAYKGWQIQDNVPTIQARLEKALAIIADHPIKVHCAGRTDTGVHGMGQVIHIDTDATRSERSWIFGTNSNLPSDISVQWAREVDCKFHARFSAIRRTYRYHILNQTNRSALLADKVVWECRPLSLNRMKAAATFLVGEHDFSAYRSLSCQAKSPVRTVYRIDITQNGSLITLEIEANAFLHHMVRNIAGVLMEVGMGRAETKWARQVLEGKDRALGGVTAKPEGLYLIRVTYPDRYNLPVASNIESLLFS